MKIKVNRQINSYRFDVASTNKDGGFLCPRCRAVISPDDHSENTYTIVDVTVGSSGLEELLLCCKNCSSLITLRGFPKDIVKKER